MLTKRPNSLKSLVLVHEIIVLFLVLGTVLLSGLYAYFWQQNSAESVRINNMVYVTDQIRGQLYRLIQDVQLLSVLKDQQARDLYLQYSSEIGEQFNGLRRNSVNRDEDIAIQELNNAYRIIQRELNANIGPKGVRQKDLIDILNQVFLRQEIDDFENKYFSMKSVLARKHAERDEKIKRWTATVPYFAVFFVLLAVILVWTARNILSKGFIRPMSHIIKGAQIFSSGQLDHKIIAEGVEEVSELAQTINGMAKDLEASRNAFVESEKQAALGALVPVVAHNIRNPLASIRATAQVLDNVKNSEELKEGRQAILDTIDHLGRWVNALVSYLHPLKPNYRLVYAGEMLDAASSLLKNGAEEKCIEIEKFGWENNLRLNADPDLMEQAIYALLTNAVDASEDNSKIRLGMVRKETELELHIQDFAEGLQFEPEPNKLTPGPSTKSFGTGLGIPIAFKICQKHGWDLKFKTVNGKGTTVIITAPIKVIEEVDE
jgi:signal transduction histidine kinase